MNRQNAGWIRWAVLLTMLPLSFSGPLGKLALSLGAPPLTIAFWRQLAAAFLTLPMALAEPESRRALIALRPRDAGRSALAGLLLACHYICWYEALHRTSIFSVTVLGCLQPFFALVGGWLLYREKARPAAVASIGLAAAGTVVMGFFSASEGGASGMAGDGLALLTALFFTAYLLCGQSARGTLPAAAYTLLLYGVCAAFLGAASLLTGVALWPVDLRVIGISVLLAVAVTFLVHSVFNWALPHVGAVYITVVTLWEPAGATLVGWMMLGEYPSLLSLSGGALVMAGVALYLAISRRKPAISPRASERSAG